MKEFFIIECWYLITQKSHLVSYRWVDGFIEELDADDRQQADAHCQDDG